MRVALPWRASWERPHAHLVHGGREGGVLAEDEHDDEEHVHVAGRAARCIVQLQQQRHEQRVQIAPHQRVHLRPTATRAPENVGFSMPRQAMLSESGGSQVAGGTARRRVQRHGKRRQHMPGLPVDGPHSDGKRCDGYQYLSRGHASECTVVLHKKRAASWYPRQHSDFSSPVSAPLASTPESADSRTTERTAGAPTDRS